MQSNQTQKCPRSTVEKVGLVKKKQICPTGYGAKSKKRIGPSQITAKVAIKRRKTSLLYLEAIDAFVTELDILLQAHLTQFSIQALLCIILTKHDIMYNL